VDYILVFKPFLQAEKKVAELATLNNVDRLDNGDEEKVRKVAYLIICYNPSHKHLEKCIRGEGGTGLQESQLLMPVYFLGLKIPHPALFLTLCYIYSKMKAA